MRITDLLDQINKSKRKKLIKFLTDRNFSDTRFELLAGDLRGNGRKDSGTLKMAICSHALYDETGKTWEFVIIIDSMAGKDYPEDFSTTTIRPSLVWDMLPKDMKLPDPVTDINPEAVGAMKEKIVQLQQELDSMKDAYQQIDGYWKDTTKKASELSLWKSVHSGNYRNAGRKKQYSSATQGESIYIMHNKEKISFRKIADTLGMSYSSARRLYQEYIENQKKYGANFGEKV